MQNWSRLILPLGLGIAAACINATALRDRIEPETVLAVRRDIAAGERLTESDLQEVKVPANAGNRRYFFLASERQNLLIARTSAVAMKEGDLVPKDVHLRDTQPRFIIPEDHLVVCARLREDVINSQLRYQLRPGRPVSVKLQHESAPLRDAQLAFLEVVPSEEKSPGALDTFQIGLIVRNENDVIARIAKHGIVSVESTAD